MLIAALTRVTKLLTLQRDVLDIRLACSAVNNASQRIWPCHPSTVCSIQYASDLDLDTTSMLNMGTRSPRPMQALEGA